VSRAEGRSAWLYLDEARMCAPAVDDAPVDITQLALRALPKQLIQTAPGRAATVLRVLRERDGALHAIRTHLRGGLLRERLRVAERDVAFVRRGRWAELVEQCAHAFALEARVAQDGRPAADVGVLLRDARGAPLGDEGREDALEGERDEVAVREEAAEEIVRFRDLKQTT